MLMSLQMENSVLMCITVNIERLRITMNILNSFANQRKLRIGGIKQDRRENDICS